MIGDHYEVKVDGAWMPVPSSKINNVIAPDGGAHVCAPKQEGVNKGVLFCVVLPPDGWNTDERIMGEVIEWDAGTSSHCSVAPPRGRSRRARSSRANCRPSTREWSDDDYDVLAEGAVVGRIFKVHAAPVGNPWMWTLAFGHHKDRAPIHGYAATREDAMGAFAKSWRRL
jgi:hypothetical protein